MLVACTGCGPRLAGWRHITPPRPIGRTINDLRIGLAALSGADPRDPWWVPAPLQGPAMPRHAALCLRPGGMHIAPEIAAALQDAAQRLRHAGWEVTELEDTPPLAEAAILQLKLWLGEGFAKSDDAATRDGDPGAIAVMNFVRDFANAIRPEDVLSALTRRSALLREWSLFLHDYAVLLLPVSADLPFTDNLDLQDFDRVWKAQTTQVGLPFLGLPALAVATGLIGTVPVGVQIVAARFREDLCLAAGDAIEAGGIPPSPIDPAF